METLLDDYVSEEDLTHFESCYHEAIDKGLVENKTQFEYAWSLIRSKYPADIRKGVVLMEDIFCRGDENFKRESLFYLAIAHTKLKDYKVALDCCKKFLHVEPANRQAQQLEDLIKRNLKKDGLRGMAIVGGAAALAVGGIVGLGIALSKK